MPRVCIVTSGHVASAPRVVKEANALAAVGHEVHVIAADITPAVRPLDLAVEQRAEWKLHRVGRGTRVRWLAGRATETLSRAAWASGVRAGRIAELSESRLVAPLARAAARLDPGLVIGHNLAGLAAAGRASEQSGCRLGFDAEDDHVGQYLPAAAARSRRVDAIQRCWLARASVTTASSPLIAASIESRYGVRPTIVLNSFDRIAWGTEAAVDDHSLRVYWVSQTIGPGRGIEQSIAVLAGCPQQWTLDLRGHIDDSYRAHLERMAAGGNGRLRFLPTIEPADVTASAAGYRLGISSEVEADENKQRCLGNKIFHYLAAGTPVWLSDTPAQRAFAAELGLAGLLLDREVATASLQLGDWLRNTREDRASLLAALDAAASRFDWRTQAERLVAAYAPTLEAAG